MSKLKLCINCNKPIEQRKAKYCLRFECFKEKRRKYIAKYRLKHPQRAKKKKWLDWPWSRELKSLQTNCSEWDDKLDVEKVQRWIEQ